jgi:transketolase C-terminal domain/subunit
MLGYCPVNHLFNRATPRSPEDANGTEGTCERRRARDLQHVSLSRSIGLAVSGKIPYAATFACFLTRAFDFIRMAGYSRPPYLILCGSHVGVSVGEDGPSKMGLEDIAMFRALISSTVLYPADAVSAERLTEAAANERGIVYIRTTRPKTPRDLC